MKTPKPLKRHMAVTKTVNDCARMITKIVEAEIGKELSLNCRMMIVKCGYILTHNIAALGLPVRPSGKKKGSGR